MKIKQVNANVSIHFDEANEEFEVRVAGNEDATYYTSDLDDAAVTAKAMAEQFAEEKLLTVQGHFGEKKVNRKDFIESWTWQLNSLWCICHDDADRKQAEEIRDGLAQLAGRHFDLEAK